MSELYLVRHAQASFHKEDYDQLSELGHKQSRHLAQRVFTQIKPEVYFSGCLKRHRQTIAPLLKLHQESNATSLKVTENKNFDEFDYFDVLQQYCKEWRTKKDMMRAIQLSSDPKKTFEDTFRHAIVRWVAAEHNHEYHETWDGFKSRVIRAIDHVISQSSSGSKTLIITSGGPISVICQYLLELSDQRTFEVNAALANTGITRIRFSPKRRSLYGLNDIAHLEQQHSQLITYR